MIARVASVAFLIDAIVIGLGAFGHGLAARDLHAAIDGFPIDTNVHSMVYVVWYFVSGCMLAFGLMLIWAWKQIRAGDHHLLVLAWVIGALYIGIGAFGLIYRHGDPFMAFFVVLGGVLPLAGHVMAPRQPSRPSVERDSTP